ncbi:undecaprenyldiphospho-muramoylpentapeptide beta-N-acetylglucosaminyltransferase [Aliihoeflea sp. PC F10.4]
MSRGLMLLSAGGTGGHLFPAEALAHELNARGWQVHLATDDRAGRFAGDFPAARVHPVHSATIASKNPIALARTFFALWKGVRQASKIIETIRPKVVIGFGGYPTLPPLYAATRRSVPTMLHEQNAVMGRANKALAGKAKAIAGGFLEPGGDKRIVVTGNPVRPSVIHASSTPYDVSAGSDPFRLLVFGGSQGAQFFSQAIPDAIRLMPAELRARLKVTQQARPDDELAVKAAYAELGIEAEVSPFFKDMAHRIASAQLVISRSGASTVSELAVIGRPSILVPYPHALDHDQAANAAALAAAGGAMVEPQSELSAERLAGLIGDFMTDADRASKMADAARSVGKPNAAALLADLAEAIAAGQTASEFTQGANP